MRTCLSGQFAGSAIWTAFRSPVPDTNAYSVLIEDFAGYMRQQRGLSEETIKGRCWCVEDFLQWFFRDHLSLSDITIAEIDEAIARKGRDDGYGRSSVKVYASGIRTFFRHAERKGWCRRGLADVIESPRVYQYEGLPSVRLGTMCNA